MKEKGKLIRIYQSDVHFPLLQDQDKDIQGAEIKSILTLKDMESIFNCIQNYITDNIKNAFYHIRIHLNNTKKIS